MEDRLINILPLPQDPRSAAKYLLTTVLMKIHPLARKIPEKLDSFDKTEEDISKIRDVHAICLSQIKKCVMNLFEVFRLEFNANMLLQETRDCNLERLSWCYKRLVSIDSHLDKNIQGDSDTSCTSDNSSFNTTIMYFVNWIDHLFEILNKLAETVYKTDYKEDPSLYEQWKKDMVECISGLHISIDELLLSAMTLYRYCLPSDQLVVKARCQVVLRETKALLGELLEGDVSNTVQATTDSLKTPVKPSNVNIMIDVLKDVLYALETNINTALLTLLIHCFCNSLSPVDILKRHYTNTEGCSCLLDSTQEEVEDCVFVKEFDLYNERLLQIGTFAVSCSSDQCRMLSLRSGLASLEALDPHLVPALMTSPDSSHSKWLINSWRQEVQEIRDSVFLIVDPAAFADKAKQIMHQKMLEVLKQTTYDNADVSYVINIGCVVHDFFNIYKEHEPNAITQQENLSPLLADLDKVQLECKVVSNLFCTSKDLKYEVKTPIKTEATLDQLHKRLKLLYTLVKRINALLQPKDQLFDDEEVQLKNVTHTVVKNGQTYVNSAKKVNLTKSVFARTHLRSSTRNYPLSKLTKRLRSKNCSQLNFSVELDRLFDVSIDKGTFVKDKRLDKVRETSILYNFSPIKNRSSMRKAVLSRHLSVFDKEVKGIGVNSGTLMDEDESLQLTEVLNQMNNMTSILYTKPDSGFKQTKTISQDNESKNILRIKINNQNATISKHVWHIPVKSYSEGMPENDTMCISSTSNLTQPSNVTTLERINDLDFVQTKLNSLKSQFETSL